MLLYSAPLNSIQIQMGKKWSERRKNTGGIAEESGREVQKLIAELERHAAEEIQKAQRLKKGYDALVIIISNWRNIQDEGGSFVMNGHLVGGYSGSRNAQKRIEKAEIEREESISTEDSVDTADVETRYTDSDAEEPIHIESPLDSDALSGESGNRRSGSDEDEEMK